jgi:hypothetical protein
MIFLLGAGRGRHRERIKKIDDVVESLDLPRCPHKRLAHLGAPRLGARATTVSWSPFSLEMKTPWWWATSVHGGGGGNVQGPRAPPASSP